MGPLITGIGASLIAFAGAKRLSNIAEQNSQVPKATNADLKPISSGRSPEILAISAKVA